MFCINATLFVLTQYCGIGETNTMITIDQNSPGYIFMDSDIFNTSMVTLSGDGENYTAYIDKNSSSDTSFITDLEAGVDPNNNFQFSTIPFGWTGIKKVFQGLLKFVTMPVDIFDVRWGYPQWLSFILQLLIGLPMTLAFVLSIGMLILGRASWN